MSNIYPPMLKSTQPAFLATEQNYKINFTLQNITSPSDFQHIQVRIVKQKDNQTVVDTKQFPDGIIYINTDSSYFKTNPYSVTIPNSFLNTEYAWKAGVLYKVQLRFGKNKYDTDISQFATWKQKQIDANAFSEWSTVMVIKAIAAPGVEIQNSGEVVGSGITSQKTEGTTTPLFIGSYVDETGNEPLEKYKFDLYYQDELIETSDWITYTSGSSCQHRFKQILTNEQEYTVKFSIQTRNGYEKSIDYNFQVTLIYLDGEDSLSLFAEQDAENASIKVYLKAEQLLTGCYVLSRASEKDNFGTYENIKYFNFFEQSFETSTLLFTDYVVESGIKYKYAIQYENSQGLRSNLVVSNSEQVNYEYAFLYRNGVQLKLQFNQKMSSFKHSVLGSKQDTLGGKYPHLVRNGRAYYAEFPLTGLISFQMDDGKTFFKNNKYQGEEVIPTDKFAKGLEDTRSDAAAAISFTIDSNVNNDNVFIERKFREKVEEFLNDLDYKLYKSPTEGNIVVGLMNVTLTPEEKLGRMLFSFSATAYEVLENTLENLEDVGIITIGSRDDEISDVYYDSFGQIEGLFNYTIDDKNCNSGELDLYSLIRQQEEVLVGDGKYQLELDKITGIRIEPYPERDLEGMRCETEAAKVAREKELSDQGKTTAQIEKDSQVVEYQAQLDANKALQNACKNTGLTNVWISINGTKILAQTNKIYQVENDDGIENLELVSAFYPVIINYTTRLRRTQNTSMGVIKQIDTSKIWGQVSGIFTEEASVLQKYKYYYEPNELPYRVYSDQTREFSDISGRIVLDYTNYNVYKTINLYEILAEETRKQVELLYKEYGGFFEDEDGYWWNEKKTIKYKLSDIVTIDIETDPYTPIYISSNAKPEPKEIVKVFVGPTGRYTLNPIDNQVRYVSFANMVEGTSEPRKGSYALINYRSVSTQTILSYSNEGSE